ncbi:MAG: hypothetical protein N3C60_07000 [Calditerrivibrio sp.]|nr:hypothetical protein [Calditerrivibrio sp.]
MINVESAVVVYSADYSSSESSESCLDSGSPVRASLELMSLAQEKVLENIMRDILPYNLLLRIVLMEDTDGIKGGNFVDKFTSALEFAKKIDWIEAVNYGKIYMKKNQKVCRLITI